MSALLSREIDQPAIEPNGTDATPKNQFLFMTSIGINKKNYVLFSNKSAHSLVVWMNHWDNEYRCGS